MGLVLWFWTFLTGSRLKGLLFEGERLLAKRRYTEALNHFRLASEQWPDRPEGFEGLGRAYQAMGLEREHRREADLGQALRKLASNPDDLVSLRQLAKGFLEKGLYALALPHAERALRLAPKDQEVLRLCALVYRYNRRHTKALEMIKRALQQEPLSADLYDQMAKNMEAAGRHLEAAKVAALATALHGLDEDPGNPAVVEKVVFQLTVSNLRELTLPLLDHALQNAPAQPTLHLLRGELLMDKGDFKAAEQALVQAVGLDPTVQKSQWLLSKAYAQEGEEAKAELHRHLAEEVEAAKTQPDPVEGAIMLVRVMLASGQPAKAQQRAEALAREHPQDWRGLLALSLVQQGLGRHAEAMLCLAKASQLDGGNPRIHLARADLYSQMGEVVEAVGQARRAAALAPRDPEVRHAVARVLRAHGHTQQAHEEEELAEAMRRRQNSPS